MKQDNKRGEIKKKILKTKQIERKKKPRADKKTVEF